MTRNNRKAWVGFAVTAAVLVAVVSWLTVVLVRLDADELQARRLAVVHERLRLALWRMDSWLAPVLAREGLRPAADYRPFPNAGTAWTKGYTRLGADEVKVQSPLLGAESPLFPLHFELSASGITSPQVPVGNERDVAEANGIAPAVLDRAAAQLRTLAPCLSLPLLEPRLGGAEAEVPMLGCNPVSPLWSEQTQQSVSELSNRQRAVVQQNVAMQGAANAFQQVKDTQTGTALLLRVGGDEIAGPLLPLWIDDGTAPGATHGPLLVFARRVTGAAGNRLQGVCVDWPNLQRELLALVPDLFGDGTALVRCERPTAAEQPSMLASLPVRLEAQCRDDLRSGLPLPLMLTATWGATLLGLLVLGITLRAAIGYGDRRARFASAVTHELRTPLTTFRMYSEMLADGVVTEPAAQREYLTTLQRESDRLARVVENVLAWSRLEEGRFTSRRTVVDTAGLVERIVPALQRRLGEAELALVVHVDDAARAASITTDEDAVGQILFNLVDNAAKYARGSVPAQVALTVAATDERVTIAVRDHGPGVAAVHRERIFAPFDRGAVAVSSNDVPGVGLGLALARGLARDLGGELRLDPGTGAGACFVLELPRG